MSQFNDAFFYRSLAVNMAKLALVTGMSYCVVTWLFKKMDPTNNEQKQSARKKAKNQLDRIGKSKLNLTEYETAIASHLVVPSDINVSWKDIAGLEDLLQEIKETVIFPIQQRQLLSSSKLTRPPKGVLLHGPPGCGKSLIAKATARESNTYFINLDISMLTDKWYGESQKHVSALFSLAEKLSPCIIFIDEIDSLLKTRSSQDHEATAMMKAQFMFLWDGFDTDTDKIVIIMGATNRPQDLDSAILRRMPATFKVPMPNKLQRKAILKLILEKENATGIDYDSLADSTNGFSGSDLQELCRMGALYRVREFANSADFREEKEGITLRSITMDDLNRALNTMTSKIDSNHSSSLLRDIKLD